MFKISSSFFLLLILASAGNAEKITLDAALNRLIGTSARGKIVNGQREVAQAQFSAQRIGYYLPEISLNTTLPTFRKSQSYDRYFGFSDPIFFKSTAISGTGNIQLKQKVITGGDLTLQAVVDLRNDEYPAFGDNGIVTATDKRRLGNLYLQFTQPLFKASESRTAYSDARDNLAKAEIEWRASQADLKKEGINAYFDLLTAEVDRQSAEQDSHLAEYNAKWDSVKFAAGAITEEAWLTTRSTRIEKQLGLYDVSATFEEKVNGLNHLLDYPADSKPELVEPATPAPPDSNRVRWFLENAEKGSETELSRIKMEMAERSLNTTRSGMGINGSLRTSYAVGRGTVNPGLSEDQKIDTRDWQVTVDLSYPIWDGGASSAGLRSQELSYESARLEYQASQRSAKNKLAILLKRLEINQSKLSLLDQELELSRRKLNDAQGRYDKGIISDKTFLEIKLADLKTQKDRLTALKNYYLDLAELEKVGTP